MIEKYLIDRGLGCGTVNNFQTAILKNIKQSNTTKWYFRTPIETTGAGLKTATLDLAFPFVAIPTDNGDEATVLTRLEKIRKCYEDDLLKFLRLKFIAPPDTAKFIVVPFWSDSTAKRKELEDFAGIRIHILNASIVVKFRDKWFE